MSCIYEGKIIENYPDDFPYPSCLIYGHAINLRVIHVVIGSDREYIFVITAYEPDAIRFEDDLKTRKEIK
ncbi:MAG: DUF4258 domain-containing protein [Lachnospiraceae bacterium]|nr:DUF4258 domain-containing protein [Lachnospiraceae bacterium]